MPLNKNVIPSDQDHNEGFDEIEAALASLFQADQSDLEPSILEEKNKLSEKQRLDAKRIAENVQRRLRNKLGLNTFGDYLYHVRKYEKLELIEITQKIKLAKDVIGQLETNRLHLFEIPVTKAADLVQCLNLDPQIVVHYLVAIELPDSVSPTPTAFFRMAANVSDNQREKNSRHSADRSERSSERERLVMFLHEFRKELARRNLLSRSNE